MSLRAKVGLLAITGTLVLGALAPASAGTSAVYRLNREGFHIALAFKGDHLTHLWIWAQERCSDGTTPARSFDETDLRRVAVKGRQLYVGGYSTDYGYKETRLSLHVTPGAINGAFRDIDEEVGYYICATGNHDRRLLSFTARRVGRSP